MQVIDHLHVPASWPARKTPVPTAQEAVWPQSPSGRKEENSLSMSGDELQFTVARLTLVTISTTPSRFQNISGNSRRGKKRTAINNILSPHIVNVFEITYTRYENVIRVFTHTKDTLCTSVNRSRTTSWRSSSVLRSFYDVVTPCNDTSWTDMRISARAV